MTQQNALFSILDKSSEDILKEWLRLQLASVATRRDLITEKELLEQSTAFLRTFRNAAVTAGLDNTTSGAWDGARQLLSDISKTRAKLGFTPSETATFVLSLKQPIFHHLRNLDLDAKAFGDEMWRLTKALDELALYTTEMHQKTREEIVSRQQQEIMELSTPVVKLWDGILALPMIGTLDSYRSQIVMESLLQRIVETGADVAIIDITGVPTVDTLTAQHLMKTVAAARLMGADCIISGVRPQIAQTIVHLAIDLGKIKTKANLADAFALALRMRNVNIKPASADR